jgi:hypothetical protein
MTRGRRVALLSLALVVTPLTSVLADIGSALTSAITPDISASGNADAPASRGTSVQLAPTYPPPVPRVLLVGDSSLEGLKFYSSSQRALRAMSYVLDAESCRRLVRASCHSLAGNVPNTAVQAIQSAPGNFDAVVIGTGYNEGSSEFSSDFDLVIAAARAKGAVRILWMNYRLRDGLTRGGTDNNGSYLINNATLEQKVASGAYPDVTIANWRDYTAPVRSWFVSDGIHYQPLGALGAADYLSRWIATLFLEPCPMPYTPTGPIDVPCIPPDGHAPPDVAALYG